MDGMGNLWEKQQRRNMERMRKEKRINWICRGKHDRAI